MAWTYCTKAMVTALYNIDADVLQDDWSDWTEALIAEHYGYAYIGTTATVTDEVHNGDGTPFLYVKYPPIVSVTSVEVGSTTPTALTSTSYKVFDDHIELINSPTSPLSMSMSGVRATFPEGVGNILVTYVSGLATVPGIVELTATQMIAEISKFNQRGGADFTMKYTGQTNTRGQAMGVVAVRGLSATLQSIMKNNLRKRVISLA